VRPGCFRLVHVKSEEAVQTRMLLAGPSCLPGGKNTKSDEVEMRKRNVAHFLTKPQGRLENTNTNMTFSMPRDTAARLREIARARDTDLQELVELAVNEWLARQLLIPVA
jgi:Ribbon-helix-helix protein, copG family